MENNSNSLAKISLGINLLLVIAVVVLFMKSPSSSATDENDEVVLDTTENLENLGEKGENAVVVYYNSDTLNAKSGFIKELQDEIMKAQMDAEDRMVKKENEIRAWEKKWQDRQPLLSSEQDQYMKEAQQKQNELMMFQQNLEQELIQKQTNLTISGINRISMFARQLAQENGYDFILQYTLGQNIIYVNPKMDITKDLLKIMNKDYYGGDGTPPSENENEEGAEEEAH